MMTDPKVTVLMSVYNGDRYLNEAIDSILAQTFTDYEFLIIDDGSTDRTLDILRSYIDPRIRIIRNEDNLGLTKSLNKGLKLSRGEYIARMDADDISLPNRLNEEVQYLEDNKDVVLVGTGREIIDEKGDIIETITPYRIITTKKLLRKNYFQHSSILFRKKNIREIGGYCSSLLCCQDYYLWLTLSKKYQLHNIPKVLCKSRIQKNSISYSKIHESALSHIFALRLFNDILTENEINYNIDITSLCRDEKIFYMTRLANYYRMNDEIKNARNLFLNIYYLNPISLFPLINFLRMAFGKKIIKATAHICRKLSKFN